MSEMWIRCSVEKGMFSDEVLVILKVLGGELVSFFVPVNKVERENEHQGRVRVLSFKDHTGTWAVLPNDQQTIVSVEASEIAAA